MSNAATLALEPLVSITHPFPRHRQRSTANPHHLIVDPKKHRRIKHFAYQHRREPTPAEAKLWLYLRRNRLGWACRRQVPFHGKYIADFCFQDPKLIVEVDGGYHQTVAQRAYDSLRTQFFAKLGYLVVRVKNRDVLLHLERVLAYLRRHLRARTYTPSPGDIFVAEQEAKRKAEFQERARLHRLTPYARIKGETRQDIKASPPTTPANTFASAVFSQETQ